MEFSLCSVSCLTGVILGLIIAFRFLGSKEKKSKKTPRGVVILHQFKRLRVGIPNISPPCMKFETYLRMTKIPYECDYRFIKSSKGKMPWIEYNGQEIADSNFCIEFLNKEFGVDVDDHLSDEQKGIARAVLVMLEDNTIWALAYWRWLGERIDELRNLYYGRMIFPIKYALFWWVQRRIKGYLHGHGIGRHTPEEIYGIAEKDLRAVSAILGEKKFLFGDKPCLADAALFALVSNFIYMKPICPQLGKVILTELKNLEEHSKRMKEAVYPDWDEICYTM